MKYGILLKILKVLVAIKRMFWWLGAGIYFVVAKIFGFIWNPIAFVGYKLGYFFKKSGFSGPQWFLKRGALQFFILLVFFVVAIPQTKLYAQKDFYLPAQKTMAYSLFGAEDDSADIEEVDASVNPIVEQTPAWKLGVVGSEAPILSYDLSSGEAPDVSIVAGGSALSKPIIMTVGTSGKTRDSIIEYTVQPGDTLSSIAFNFNISISTVLWENNLTARSIIRPGDKLDIPPITGLYYKVKKGDNLQKIANRYTAQVADIVKFNKLKEDGTDLKIGAIIMIPNGVKPYEQVVVAKPKPTASTSYGRPSVTEISTSGFVWPTAVHVITQYYGITHHAIDIAGGPIGTPNYAAKAGQVEVSQCGWNHGYGCYIIINHGNGVKTLYGHNSKLLVSPGDYVEAGQTIGLMGNTGNVRGITGVHLHFEVQVNGVRVNPLSYVR